MSQYQLIPYERVADYFINESSIPISVGSLFNFNQEAYHLLEAFDALAKQRLIAALVLNADETPITVLRQYFGVTLNGYNKVLYEVPSREAPRHLPKL